MKYDYIRFFEEKLKLIAQEDEIIDIGGGHPFEKRMAKYRSWFLGRRYRTVDSSTEYNPDIVGDAHQLPLADKSVGAIVCLSVLEHLTDPGQAVNEMLRVLRPGGKALIYTHFIYPYHARRGVYGDYFRFTEEGMRHLFRNFSRVEVKKQGGYFRAIMFFMPGQRVFKAFSEPLAYVADKLTGSEKRSTTAGYYIYAVK